MACTRQGSAAAGRRGGACVCRPWPGPCRATAAARGSPPAPAEADRPRLARAQTGLRLASPHLGGDGVAHSVVGESIGERGERLIGCGRSAAPSPPRPPNGIRSASAEPVATSSITSRSTRFHVSAMIPIVRWADSTSSVSAAWGKPRGMPRQSPGSRTRSRSDVAEFVGRRLADRRTALDRTLRGEAAAIPASACARRVARRRHRGSRSGCRGHVRREGSGRR